MMYLSFLATVCLYNIEGIDLYELGGTYGVHSAASGWNDDDDDHHHHRVDGVRLHL
jgi:hypothetical protein